MILAGRGDCLGLISPALLWSGLGFAGGGACPANKRVRMVRVLSGREEPKKDSRGFKARPTWGGLLRRF